MFDFQEKDYTRATARVESIEDLKRKLNVEESLRDEKLTEAEKEIKKLKTLLFETRKMVIDQREEAKKYFNLAACHDNNRIRAEKERDEAAELAKEADRRATEAEEERDALKDGAHNLQCILEREKEKERTARRAVHIAAVIMQAAGLCRYDDVARCRKVWPAEDDDCVACIEKWLLAKARREIRKEPGK